MRIITAMLLTLFACSVAFAEDMETGEEVFRNRCDTCHQLPAPEMLKPGQWKVVLGVMQKRMEKEGQDPLTTGELEKVTAYVTDKARK